MYSGAVFGIRGRSVAAFTLMYVATLAVSSPPLHRDTALRCFVTSHEYIPYTTQPQPPAFYHTTKFYFVLKQQGLFKIT